MSSIETADLDNVEVVCADATSLEFADALEGDDWVMVSNLPYNVGTGIVLDTLRRAPRISRFVVMVQKEVGGNLTEILEQIAQTMRARFTLRRQVRVYTAQGRMSGYTLAALPIFVGAMISLINPPYLRTLFVDPIGQVMLAGAVMLQGIGFLWIRKIVDIRY